MNEFDVKLQELKQQIDAVTNTMSVLVGKPVNLQETPEAIVELLQEVLTKTGKCYYTAVCFRRSETTQPPLKPEGGSWVYNEEIGQFEFTPPDGWVLSAASLEDDEDQSRPIWMSSAIFDSTTSKMVQDWQEPARITGNNGKDGKDGEKGADGADGKNAGQADNVFKSIVFKRSKTKPTQPLSSEGSYANPVPTGWYDGIPDTPTEDSLWMSSRIFTLSGKAPQQSAWDMPSQVASTSGMEVLFSSVDSPDTPDIQPENWHAIGTSLDKYMAIQLIKEGSKKPWSIVRIKGENGKDGTSVRILGEYESEEALIEAHPTGEIGDAYIVQGDLFVWIDDIGWKNVGSIKGPKGDQGETGAQGQDGQDGQNGQDGVTYYVHIRYANKQCTNFVDPAIEVPSFIAYLVDTNVEASTVFDDYTWLPFRGEDGISTQFVYCLTTDGETPVIEPVEEEVYNDVTYVPEGWTDMPSSITPETPYAWVCTRTQNTDGSWPDYAGKNVALWARYATDGKSIQIHQAYQNDGIKSAYDKFAAEWIPGGIHKAPEDASWCMTVQRGTATDLNEGSDLWSWDGDSWVNVGAFGGQNGVSSYIHVRYKDTEDGTMYIDPTPSSRYIGFATSSKEIEPPVPALVFKWSKFKGEDGFGYEYVYHLGAATFAPNLSVKIGDDPTVDEYLPYCTDDNTRWDDDAIEPLIDPDRLKCTCWCAKRVKKNVNGVMTWGDFSAPYVYTKSAERIISVEKKYARTQAPIPPEYLPENMWEDTDPGMGEEDVNRYLYIRTTTTYYFAAPDITYIEQYTPKDGQDGEPGAPGADGTNGVDGQMGLTAYNAGEWSSTKLYEKTTTICPYVSYKGNYYLLNVPSSLNNPPAVGSNWLLMDQFKNVFTELLIAENGRLGQFYFSGDYMFSDMGMELYYDEEEGWYREEIAYSDIASYVSDYTIDFANMYVFTGVNPSDTSQQYWAPYYWINQNTGEVVAQRAKFTGELKATSGTIGGMTIESNALSSIVDTGAYINSVFVSPGVITTATRDKRGREGQQTCELGRGAIKFTSGSSTYTLDSKGLRLDPDHNDSLKVFDVDGNLQYELTCDGIHIQNGMQIIFGLSQDVTILSDNGSVAEFTDSGIRFRFGDCYFNIGANGIHTNTDIIKD